MPIDSSPFHLTSPLAGKRSTLTENRSKSDAMRTDPPLLLPLACEEISPAVRHALRYAGLPCVDVDQQTSTHRQETRFLLTDRGLPHVDKSRSASVTLNSKRLSHSGRSRTIDVQSLLTAESAFTLPHAEATLMELKSTVEKQGGIWARVGDFPYPYRAALCEATHSELAELTSTLGYPASQLAEMDEVNEDDQLLRVYLAGGLILRPRESSLCPHNFSSADNDGTEQMPLLWRMNCRDFAKWWRIREQLHFSIARHKQGFTVRCSGESKQWRPAIEVWNKNHVATLPWVSHDYLWKIGQHIWKQERHKHPAGLFCLAKLMDQALSSRYEVGLKQSA